MEELILDLIDYDVEDEYEEDDEEGTITIYGNPKSYAAIQKHLEECGFEDVGGDFTYIPNDLKEVTPEQRETLDKMIERLEEFDFGRTISKLLFTCLKNVRHSHANGTLVWLSSRIC